MQLQLCSSHYQFLCLGRKTCNAFTVFSLNCLYVFDGICLLFYAQFSARCSSVRTEQCFDCQKLRLAHDEVVDSVSEFSRTLTLDIKNSCQSCNEQSRRSCPIAGVALRHPSSTVQVHMLCGVFLLLGGGLRLNWLKGRIVASLSDT
jgi:hypothetical protein